MSGESHRHQKLSSIPHLTHKRQKQKGLGSRGISSKSPWSRPQPRNPRFLAGGSQFYLLISTPPLRRANAKHWNWVEEPAQREGKAEEPQRKKQVKRFGVQGDFLKIPLVAAAAAKSPILRRRAPILPFNFHPAPPAVQCEALELGRRTNPTISKVLQPRQSLDGFLVFEILKSCHSNPYFIKYSWPCFERYSNAVHWNAGGARRKLRGRKRAPPAKECGGVSRLRPRPEPFEDRFWTPNLFSLGRVWPCFERYSNAVHWNAGGARRKLRGRKRAPPAKECGGVSRLRPRPEPFEERFWTPNLFSLGKVGRFTFPQEPFLS